MAKSSIHFQGVKSNSESHNKRLNQNLDYIFKDLSHENKNISFTANIEEGIKNSTHIEFLKKIVKEKTGRAAQKNAHMLQEAVFNFNENHSDDDIKIATESFCEQMNLVPVRLNIHRDEGHDLEDGTRKLNLHAHLTVEWISRKNGKSHKWTKEEASRSQTVLAKCLGMERGKESNRKHLDSLEFKIKAKADKLLGIEKNTLKSLEIEKNQNIIPNNHLLQSLQNEQNSKIVKLLIEANEKKILDFNAIFKEMNPELWSEALSIRKKIREEKEKNNIPPQRNINLELQIKQQEQAIISAQVETAKFIKASEQKKQEPRAKRIGRKM